MIKNNNAHISYRMLENSFWFIMEPVLQILQSENCEEHFGIVAIHLFHLIRDMKDYVDKIWNCKELGSFER